VIGARLGRLALVAVLVSWPQAVTASGTHAVAKAALSFSPQTPRVGQAWQLSIAIQSSDRALHPARRVKVVGEMTGHAMRPVEVELTRTSDGGTYEGALAFTMRGPWRITVRVEDLNDVLTAAFDLEVVRPDESSGFDDMRTMLDLHPPVRANLLPPGWTLLGVIVLALAFEWAAWLLSRRPVIAPPPASRPDAPGEAPPVSSPA
jgi:hypothetical protein